MQIKKAVFIKSASDKSGFMSFNMPVIAVCGRSNVGKSSFINMLAGNKKLAKTSDTPGRTRLVNYFDFGEFILVDLPGYGYAEAPKSEKLKWAKSLDDFFELTKIDRAITLIDVRRDPTEDDKTMLDYLYAKAISFNVITTKADKLSKLQGNNRVREIAAKLGLGESDIIKTDRDGTGKSEVLKLLDEVVRAYHKAEQ